MYPQGDGTTLEKGRMLNPDTGKDTDYEELWLDLSPKGQSVCAVLKLEGSAARGMIVWLGSLCQALVRDADGITLERWEMVNGEGWKRTVRLGAQTLPCEDIFNGRVQLAADSKVAGGWDVVEYETN